MSGISRRPGDEQTSLALPLPGGLAMRFVKIPAGSFWMGSRGQSTYEEPRHRVLIPRDFHLGQYVVTQAEWRALAETDEALKHRLERHLFKGDRLPVEGVSWDDANEWLVAWSSWLGRQWNDLPSELRCGWELRLPTEAEWEYACRGGTETEFYSGDGEAALAEVGWYSKNSGRRTHSVDEKPERHPWGLCGMHGNVNEWCRDVYYGGTYRQRIDGDAVVEVALQEGNSDDGWRRVVRGGSRVFAPRRCRAAYRRMGYHGDGYMCQGFRACLASGPAEPSKKRLGDEAGQGAECGGRRMSPEPPAPGTADPSRGSADLARARLPRRRRNPGGAK